MRERVSEYHRGCANVSTIMCPPHTDTPPPPPPPPPPPLPAGQESSPVSCRGQLSSVVEWLVGAKEALELMLTQDDSNDIDVVNW